MKPVLLAALTLLIGFGPALARPPHRDGHAHRHSNQGGMPIINGNPDIRVNSVGEVLSTPPAVVSDRQGVMTPKPNNGTPAKP